MKEIYFVTTNKGKLASAKRHITNAKVIGYSAELIEPRSEDLREIAKQKVIQAYTLVKKPCIALDAGFFVKALNGFPKAYVNPMLNTIGIKGIIKLMKDVEDRHAEFRECLAYYDGKKFEFFEATYPGKISKKIIGVDMEDKWSELWHIFIPQNFDKALVEFSKKDFEKYDRQKETNAMTNFGKWYDAK